MSSFNGVLRVNKPVGMSSHDVVGKARRLLGQREIGHAGTLDPMAGGLLVLLLGKATKISDYILNGDKAYRARVKLGLSTDTWDLEGEVLTEQNVCLDRDKLSLAVESLQGEFNWPVPRFSAVKQRGEKLYEKARNGEEFEVPRRLMHFKKVELLEASSDEVEVQLLCSKGSFIRTWATELGRELGVPSCLSFLERNFSEPFPLRGAVGLDELEDLTEEELRSHEAFLDFSECLGHFPALSLKGRDLRLMLNGQIPNALVRRMLPLQKECNGAERAQITRIFDAEARELVALLEVRPRASIRVRRIFKSS